jgi:hypothetical protein
MTAVRVRFLDKDTDSENPPIVVANAWRLQVQKLQQPLIHFLLNREFTDAGSNDG